LQKDKPETSGSLRLAATQYRAYIALTPNLPPKEIEHYNEKAANLEEKAYKVRAEGSLVLKPRFSWLAGC